MRKALRQLHGFTLLELIVVLGIFGVLSVMAYGGLNSVLQQRAGVQKALDRTVAMQKAYLRLRNDFQQLRDRTVRNGFGEKDPALMLTTDGRVEFTRGGWRNPLSQPRSSLERVSYRVDEKNRLLRESWRVLDRAQDSALVETPVLEDVEDLEWRFLDEKFEWQSAWPAPGLPASSGAKPPRAVELTLQTKDWGELKFVFAK